MSRFTSRALAALGAGAVAVAVSVGGGVPAGAAPASGPITEAKDVLGVWLGELSGYEAGQEVDWQYRLTVRKAKGQAGVAWEEWRDCGDHAAACAAGKATGGGWSQPSRVLFAMDSNHVIHGVSASGRVMGEPDETGNTFQVVMVCPGSTDAMWVSTPVTSGSSPKAMDVGAGWQPFVVTGAIARQPS